MNFFPWRSNDGETQENRFSRLWDEVQELEEELKTEGINLGDVEEFGEIAEETLESGRFFKSRETGDLFDDRLTEDDLRQYSESGLITEIDFGDHKNFFFITDRGEYAIENHTEIVRNRNLYEEIKQEDGEDLWKIGQTDQQISEGPTAHRGDIENDYVVKEDSGGLLKGGWNKVLTEKGQKAKETVKKYDNQVLQKLVEASPHPDPEAIKPVETILIEGNSRIGERIQMIETFMTEKRKSYISEHVENSGDGHKGYSKVGEEMLDDWNRVLQSLDDRREKLRTESGELVDEGTEYLEVLEEKIKELEGALVYIDDEPFNPSRGDLEKVKEKMVELEKTYSDEFNYTG